jgi:anti-sigma factor RsiW
MKMIMSENHFYDSGGHISTVAMSLALDGFLDLDDRQQVDQHVLVCAACAARWSTWQHLDDALRTEPLVGPAPGFVLRVDRRLADRQKRRERWLGGLVLIGGTVSIWTLLVAGLVLVSAVSMWLSPGARLQVLELLGYGGQLVGAVASSLSALRDSTVNGIPAPMLIGFAGAALMAIAFLWVRLIPPSHTHHSSGVSGNVLNVSYSSIDSD